MVKRFERFEKWWKIAFNASSILLGTVMLLGVIFWPFLHDYSLRLESQRWTLDGPSIATIDRRLHLIGTINRAWIVLAVTSLLGLTVSMLAYLYIVHRRKRDFPAV
jgi:hypothetical protein